MRRGRRLLPVVMGLTALIICAQAFAAGQNKSANAAYAAGVAAFTQGDYSHALAAFLQARASGYTGAQLDYSLGATYYRLGRYDLAKREFESLLYAPKLAALCHYNLGLIAAAQGDSVRALREYRTAYSGASEPAIKRLAAAEIARIAPPVPRVSPWFGYATLSAGYDDNVALAPQSGVTLPARQGSSLLTLLAGGGGQLTGSYVNGLRLMSSYYSTDYQRLSQYNQTILNLGAQYRYAWNDWAVQAGASTSHMTLGGSGFENLEALRFDAQKRLSGEHTLAAGYQYARVFGFDDFNYLSGWQQQAFVEDRITGREYVATVGYQHEINKRNDLTTATEFFSASPTRNRVYTRVRIRQTERWGLDLDLAYERSRYANPDVLDTGNSPVTIGRSDTLYIGEIGAEYQIASQWNLKAAYRYLRNASNISTYSYQSNLYSISIEYLLF